MEVADQWRREWAGTAEFGKVVEGGVTRQIARAMEVLHASGPGARVRVMRAAFHSSAGPGLPASSYMVHSSRRVISSGFNFMDTPSLPSKPLEISSIPFDLSQDSNTDTENYKVTEPDDTDISEPSKWRSSLSGSSLRMPSEESSSTDNASIIDLDPRPNKPFYRKQSYDSENSDINFGSGRTSRASPLLDAPVTLSTLKFKSLLNGNNDWNSRRKSYSFEDTSPLTETILHSNETLAMESSTDSGICKSTEIVNDNTDDYITSKYCKDRDINKGTDTFQSWLSNNKQNNYYKGNKFKKVMEHDVVVEEPADSNITLQSTGKVSITLPIAIETDDGYVYRNNEENNRKTKKVEFCKTELHFAADTGKVNIISTDDKPPPSNDFRKRRSAFVPLREMSEKPITLFGERINEYSNVSKESVYTFSEYNESDENTAATKSILKNKIPKPKPYLLGENMAFGTKDDEIYDDSSDTLNVPTAVSLINKQLRPDERTSPKPAKRNLIPTDKNTFRTISEGPTETPSKQDIYGYRRERTQKTVRLYDDESTVNEIKTTQPIKRSPTPGRIKTRELRESDLTYFGVSNSKTNTDNNSHKPNKTRLENNDHEVFKSVRLIKEVSNSVCNSESEDSPEYQNIPFNNIYVPKPTPRQRTKFEDNPNQIDEIKVLKPVIEHERESRYDDMTISRRSKLRRQEEVHSLKNRSRSEPRKNYQINSSERPLRKVDQPVRSTENNDKTNVTKKSLKTDYKVKSVSDDEAPIYENIKDLIKNDHAESKIGEVNLIRPIILDSKDSKTTSERKSHVSTKQSSRNDKTNKNNETQHKYSRKTQLDDADYSILELKSNNIKEGSKQKSEKSEPTKDKLKIKNSSESTKSNKSHEHKKRDITNTDRREHKLRTDSKELNGTITKHSDMEPVRIERRKESSVKKRNIDTEKTKEHTVKKNNSDTEKSKEHKLDQSQSHHKENSSGDTLKMIPKVVPNSSKIKSMGNKDHSSRPVSRTKRNEYVINYDDKNGTVSSVTKIRSNSGSPRRKPMKEVTRDKYKDSLNKKSTDKVALLQTEDHQWIAGAQPRDKRRKSKLYEQRSCQVL